VILDLLKATGNHFQLGMNLVAGDPGKHSTDDSEIPHATNGIELFRNTHRRLRNSVTTRTGSPIPERLALRIR
jgi:hypothetical protein